MHTARLAAISLTAFSLVVFAGCKRSKAPAPAPAASSAAAAIYMEYGSIKGEAQNSPAKQQEIQSFSFGVNAGTAPNAGAAATTKPSLLPPPPATVKVPH